MAKNVMQRVREVLGAFSPNLKKRARIKFFELARRSFRQTKRLKSDCEFSDIFTMLRLHQARVARVEACTSITSLWLVLFWSYVSYFLFLSVSLHSVPNLTWVDRMNEKGWTFLVGVAPAFLLLVLAFRLYWFVRWVVLTMATMLACGLTTVWYINSQGIQTPFWLSSGMLGALWIFVLYLGSELIKIVIARVSHEGLARSYPDSLFVHKIVHAWWITTEIRRWNDLNNKRELMYHIESSARILTHYLPKRIRAFDPRSELWISERGQQNGAALREYKRWVFSPEGQTRLDLSDQLKQVLSRAVQGEWGSLPRKEVEKLTLSQFRKTVIHVLITVGRSVVPLFVVVAWYHSPLSPPRPLFEKALLTTAAICAGYLLLSLDPAAESKTKSAGSILSVFTKFPGT